MNRVYLDVSVLESTKTIHVHTDSLSKKKKLAYLSVLISRLVEPTRNFTKY